MTSDALPAAAAGHVKLGDLSVARMGFGAMRLPGPGVWGPPADREQALSVVRRAAELGVNAIDTAWYYGLDVANELIAAALRRPGGSPYSQDLVLITKLGGARRDDGSWHSALTPEGLRAGNERDRRVLGLDSIPVTHLRWMDGAGVSFGEALDAMVTMRDEGLIRHIGLSNVTLDQLEAARAQTEIVSVSNQFGPGVQDDAPVLDRCAELGIAYLPFFPLVSGAATGGAAEAAERAGVALAKVATKHGITPAQASLAWLLHRAPTVVAIPGTSSVAHLEENVAAAAIELDDDDMRAITAGS